MGLFEDEAKSKLFGEPYTSFKKASLFGEMAQSKSFFEATEKLARFSALNDDTDNNK